MIEVGSAVLVNGETRGTVLEAQAMPATYTFRPFGLYLVQLETGETEGFTEHYLETA